jgi:hypothetical protein
MGLPEKACRRWRWSKLKLWFQKGLVLFYYFLLFLRGVRFSPHKEGPGFESRPGTLRGILQWAIAMREKKWRGPSNNISIPVKGHINIAKGNEKIYY